ncbi:MAG: hypothetical protein ACI4E1_13475 [Lachnospira sp.]
MIVKPLEFGMIQQQNSVAQIKHNENTRPVVEQQNMVQIKQQNDEARAEQVVKKDNADNFNRGFDAKEKSSNEYYSDGKGNSKKKTSDGKVFIKGQGNIDFDVKI